MIKAEGGSIDGFLIGETYEHADIHVGPERLTLGKVGSDKANHTKGKISCCPIEEIPMAEKFPRYDSVGPLKTDEDIEAYLETSLEEASDDPSSIARALGVIARARNMSQLARDTGMTREGLYKALSGEGNPTMATVAKVADALGYKLSLKRKHI